MTDNFTFITPDSSGVGSTSKDAEYDPDKSEFFFVKPPEKKDERTAKEFAEAAGIGAAAGAASRYKGIQLSNMLAPGKGVFQPSEESVKAINAKLQQLTKSPNADVRSMTDEQINRLLSGGEGATLGTSGRQRTETFNLESQRRARTQQEIENLVHQNFPGTRDPLTSLSGPVVTLDSGLNVPSNVASEQAARQFAQDAELYAQADKALSRNAMASGLSKIGQGSVGGALLGAQAYNMYKQPQPADWTQYLSLLGNAGITLGGPLIGALGGLAQIPYAVKNRDEIARGLTLGDINPTVFGGAPESLETPIGNLMGNK